MREILINIQEEEKRIAFLENGKLDEFYIEREEGEQLIGNIYKGKVDNVSSAIQAAFVNIGLEKNGFLHLSDIEPDAALYREMEGDFTSDLGVNESAAKSGKLTDLVKKNQEVLVQVVKAPIGSKGVRLSTNISIPGRHLVLMPKTKLRGVSRKIADRDEKIRLKKLLAELKLPKDIGVIVRTAAGGINNKVLVKELKYLLSTWKRIQHRIKITKTPGRVHSDLGVVLRIIRDSLTEQITRVVIDSKKEFKLIRKFVSIFLPTFKSRLELYDGALPLFEKCEIEKEILKVFNRKVWLKNGGYLVIDPTEALVSIDVNSGKYVKTKDMEETALKTNLEAAKIIGRQLKLRNIGGIVIVDFIDMESAAHQKSVLKELKFSIKKDRAKINIYPFSKLGLVQITRQRIKESIAQEVFEDCPYCNGKGNVKSLETMMIEIKRKLREWVKSTRGRQVTVTTSSELYKYLMEGKYQYKWKKDLRIHIKMEVNKELHQEKYQIA